MANKTSSTIIQHLQTCYGASPTHAVAYFYFDFNNSAKQEVWACFSSIVAQLCAHISSLPPYIKQSYERSGHGKFQPSLGELIELLFDTMRNLSHVFIVIDAVDECPRETERDLLLNTLSHLKSKMLENLHVLVTSRRETDIEDILLPLLTVPAIALQRSEVDLDIKLHITNQLATDPKLKKWSREVQAEIEQTLMAGANGM